MESQVAKSKLSRLSSAILLERVSKRYKRQVPLLESVSLNLCYGEIQLISGPSGSGKSTILQIASALLPPDSGQVVIDTRAVFSSLPVDDTSSGAEKGAWKGKHAEEVRRSLISYLPQEDYLIESLSVEENISLALDLHREGRRAGEKSGETSQQRIAKLLSDLGIDRLAERSVLEISAGERRRVAIARSLVRKPKIVIADEPTNCLDIERSIELMKLFRKRANDESKTAFLIASHDVAELVPFVDSALEIKNCSLRERNLNC